MMEIDKKIASFLGMQVRINPYVSSGWGAGFWLNGQFVYGDFHAWLLSPPGTVAMMEKLMRDGQRLDFFPTINRVYARVGSDYNERVSTGSVPTAVYEAVKKYMEDK
jgi:hypothetical protein